MTKLGVNIDHIATIRQARHALEPDPVAAAVIAELAGADGITIHLRGDRRHIQDDDVRRLRETVTTRLNMEMAPTPEMVRIALRFPPDQVTFVPEKPGEVTTEGGLDILKNRKAAASAIRELQKGRLEISLFIEQDHGCFRPRGRAWVEDPCRARPDLPKRPADLRHRGHRGAQHRPQHRRARRACRHGTRRKGNAPGYGKALTNDEWKNS